ncbi:hypothetical protein Cylst_0372 [Cylindrospermum stagnale PCC 7417]|uniref:Uncharacterized protein n=1 Tax=Cylindrospermum stagnale PCC 7417 TaxID=56107 RepID=K9WRA8_9NOST|nr:hypothetical protein Cylst_0372 [Cylindrospermum stagnale PCC 7417]
MQVHQSSLVKIMEQNQDHQRRAAAQEFQKALEQLEGILQENPTEDEVTPGLHTGNASDEELCENLGLIDLAAFEDAVADIEKYLEERTKRK